MSFPLGVIAGPKESGHLQLILSVAGLLTGAAIAYWLYRHWQEAHEEADPVTNEELLAEFQGAYASGEMDEAEYRRVTELLRKPGAAARGAARRPAPPAKSLLPESEAPAGTPPTAPKEGTAPPGPPDPA